MLDLSKRLFLRILCFLCLLSIYALIPAYVFAQDRSAMAPRTVQLEPSLPQDPAKIVKVMLGGVEIKPVVQASPANKPGVPFQAGDEWFKDLAVVVKNMSAKKIVFARVQVYFPETGDGTKGHPTVGDQSSVGQIPENGRYSGITGQRLDDPPRDPILVGPGQEMTIPVISRFGDDHFEDVKSMIESRQSLSSVTTCVVGLSTFYFDDGTKWASGHYYRPDPNVRGRHIVISLDEFNGRPASN